jgi:cytochrome o ubiquinol oxidase subunit 2
MALAAWWYLSTHYSQIAILDPAGPIAAQEKDVILITVALCAIVVIPVYVLLFVFAWRYRVDNTDTRHTHMREWDHTRQAEVITWLIPSAIIVLLSILAWQSSHALDPYKPLPGNALEVEVVALDWKWLFIYPQQGIATVNMLEIPENVPVHFDLTADAPMNSFWIPQLGGQIMVMPGMSTQLSLEADRVGTFNGFSGNISGNGFAGMAFSAHAVSQSDFNEWVHSVQASSTPLDQQSYATLSAPSEYNPVAYYSPVASGLYDGVMMSFMLPANEMPVTAVPDAQASASQSMPGMHMQ